MWPLGIKGRREEESRTEASLLGLIQSATAIVVPTGDLEKGRLRLLSEVARERHASDRTKERTSMLNLTLTKRLALGAAAVLAVGAVGAAGASGGVSSAAGNVSDVLAALHVTDRTPDEADSHIDAIQPPSVPAASSEDKSANDNANDNASEGAGNADDGIKNSNASEQGLDHAADNASQGSGNADGDHGPSALPDQANDRAVDGNAGQPGVPDGAGVPSHVDLPDQAEHPPVPGN